MSVADDFKTVMDADSGAGGVATLLTGGTHVKDANHPLGITLTNTPDAFSGLTLLPCSLIKARARIPGPVMAESYALLSWAQVIEVYLYVDVDTAVTVLETTKERLLTVVHGQRVNSRKTLWINEILDQIEEPLDNAHMIRVDFRVYGVG